MQLFFIVVGVAGMMLILSLLIALKIGGKEGRDDHFINSSPKPKKWFDISKNVDNKQVLYNCFNRDQAISSWRSLGTFPKKYYVSSLHSR